MSGPRASDSLLSVSAARSGAVRIAGKHYLGRSLRAWLLFAALFCVTGQQFLESSHAHAVHETSQLCQLCSGFTDTAVRSTDRSLVLPQAAACVQTYSDTVAPSRFVPAFHPRGPPRYS